MAKSTKVVNIKIFSYNSLFLRALRYYEQKKKLREFAEASEGPKINDQQPNNQSQVSSFKETGTTKLEAPKLPPEYSADAKSTCPTMNPATIGENTEKKRRYIPIVLVKLRKTTQKANEM